MDSNTGSSSESRSLLTQLTRAIDGARVESIRLAAAAAMFAAARADDGALASDIVFELDAVQAAALDALRAKLSEADDARLVLDAARRVQAASARARLAAVIGFDRAASANARRGSRIARHDMANAIGTIRNAVILMGSDAEAASAAGSPAKFREIAVRNTSALEQMIRVEFSDNTTARAARLRASNALFDELTAPADVRFTAEERAALRDLAAAVGVTLEFDDTSRAVVVADSPAAPSSARNLRNDLGRTREGDHLNPLGF